MLGLAISGCAGFSTNSVRLDSTPRIAVLSAFEPELTQLVLDRFNVQSPVFSGIAGGVNPTLHIGDVSVPAQWGPNLEVLMARETAPGTFSLPMQVDGQLFPPYGALHPRSVQTRTAANPKLAHKFWFEVDPAMLAVAHGLSDVELSRCSASQCLAGQPKVIVGGNGVAGQTFVDNAVFRE